MAKNNRVNSLFKNVVFLFVLQFTCLFVEAETSEQSLHKLLELKGELTQGSAIKGKAPVGSSLWLNDQAISMTVDGYFFIGFGRDAELTQTLKYQSKADKVTTEELILTKRKYMLQEVNGVPQKTVTPNKKHSQRIQAENALVKKARSTFSHETFFLEKFVAPMNSQITGVYGSQRIFNGVPKRPHFGVDYAGPVGALVYAPASGVVTLAHDDMFYSGGTLILDHGFGVSSSFLHLSELLVKEGQRVKQGDVIAKVGKGGRASGPHLDWRMNWFDVRIDPLKVLEIN